MFHGSSLSGFAPLMNLAAEKLTRRCLAAPVTEGDGEKAGAPAGPAEGAPSPGVDSSTTSLSDGQHTSALQWPEKHPVHQDYCQ